MNNLQKISIFFGFLLLFINFIIVPYNGPGEQNIGYQVIFDSAKYSAHDYKSEKETKNASDLRDGLIDIKQLLIQAAAIICITIVLFFLSGMCGRKGNEAE